MILPGKTQKFQGVVGGTFDTVITLFEGVPFAIWGGFWQSVGTYQANTIVIGSDSNAYISTRNNTNVNPVGDLTGTWTELTPLNLTGYTAAFQINPPTGTPQASDPDPVITSNTGQIAVNITAIEMAAFTAGTYPCYLQITDPSADVYYPVIGDITLVNPI